MSVLSAHDVAREIRSQLPTSGVVKIHKLLYMCQGWHLAWYGEAMFVEDIEAWDNGPVVADVWRDEKSNMPPPQPEQLTGGQLLVLDYVIAHYGGLTGRELIEMTHAEGPWRSQYDRGWTAGKVITVDDLRDFFISAAKQDRDDEPEPAEVRELIRRAAADTPIDMGEPVVDEVDDIRRWLNFVTS